MRKLLNTLYVMTESCYLTLDGENIRKVSPSYSGKHYLFHIQRQQSGVDGRLCRAEDRYELLFAQRCILGKGQRKGIR